MIKPINKITVIYCYSYINTLYGHITLLHFNYQLRSYQVNLFMLSNRHSARSIYSRKDTFTTPSKFKQTIYQVSLFIKTYVCMNLYYIII